jgi:hypothetical protein
VGPARLPRDPERSTSRRRLSCSARSPRARSRLAALLIGPLESGGGCGRHAGAVLLWRPAVALLAGGGFGLPMFGNHDREEIQRGRYRRVSGVGDTVYPIRSAQAPSTRGSRATTWSRCCSELQPKMAGRRRVAPAPYNFLGGGDRAVHARAAAAPSPSRRSTSHSQSDGFTFPAPGLDRVHAFAVPALRSRHPPATTHYPRTRAAANTRTQGINA